MIDESGRYWTPTTSEIGEYPAAADTLSEVGRWIVVAGESPAAPTPILRIGPDRRAGN